MDEKVRSSWSLKAAQAGIAPQAGSPLGLSAIAALPVLPSAFSTANAEQRREAEPEKYESHFMLDDAATKPLHAAPVVKPMQGAPALASDAQALAQAPVRISDLAPAQAEKDAPSCRAGDATSLDPGQTLPTPRNEQDRLGAERPGRPETPLPHCIIEFDPDADDGDVIAHAPSPQTVQVVAKSASAPKQVAEAQAAGTPPQQGTTQGEQLPPANAEPASTQATEQATAQAPATPTISDSVLMVTQATRGVGAAVIDPLLPFDSIVFGGDMSLLSLAEAPLMMPVAPDPVADALAALGTGPEPDLFPGLGTDLFFT